MHTLHGITTCQQPLTQNQIVLSSLHENLLQLLRALGCCSGFLQRHRQLIWLLDCGQHVLLLLASGLIKAWEHISQGAWLSGNAAGASLQRYPATLQACIAQNMMLVKSNAVTMLQTTFGMNLQQYKQKMDCLLLAEVCRVGMYYIQGVCETKQ